MIVSVVHDLHRSLNLKVQQGSLLQIDVLGHQIEEVLPVPYHSESAEQLPITLQPEPTPKDRTGREKWDDLRQTCSR